MRVVFMGTPEIAATCLEGLLTGGFDVVAVYTKPDTPQNRGMKLTQSPVKRWPRPMGSRLPARRLPGCGQGGGAAGSEAGCDCGGGLRPDFASGRAGYSLPGLHQHSCQPAACAAGLRPRAMGGASGAGRDRGHGHVYGGGNGRRGYDCHPADAIGPNENAQSLLDRLAKLGAELLAETLTRLAQGPVAATPQDHTKATLCADAHQGPVPH